MHVTAKFHHPTFSRSEVIVRTNKETNKQTPLKTSTSLRCATPVGENCSVNAGCRTLGGILDERSHCYTLEVSFYSYTTTTGATTVTQPYTEEACILLGCRLLNGSTLATAWNYHHHHHYILGES